MGIFMPHKNKTFSGKSTLILKLLQDRKNMFSSEFAEVWYCMPKEVLDMETAFVAELQHAVPGIIIFEGIPNFIEMAKDKRHRLLILVRYNKIIYA